MFRNILVGAVALLTASVYAENVPIYGTVEGNCIVVPDTTGVYGVPASDTLSTAVADGGVLPVVRYDVIIADYYKAVITTPTAFSESPPLNDVVNWTGSAAVHEVSDAGMSAYDTGKVEYNSTTEFDLTIAGSTWFEMDSKAEYGYDKPFPGGNYTAMVEANCIAK
jgi:hypothetical protein